MGGRGSSLRTTRQSRTKKKRRVQSSSLQRKRGTKSCYQINALYWGVGKVQMVPTEGKGKGKEEGKHQRNEVGSIKKTGGKKIAKGGARMGSANEQGQPPWGKRWGGGSTLKGHLPQTIQRVACPWVVVKKRPYGGACARRGTIPETDQLPRLGASLTGTRASPSNIVQNKKLPLPSVVQPGTWDAKN